MYCIFNYMYVFLYGNLHANAGAHRGQRWQDSVELEFQAVVSSRTWVLGTEHRSSAEWDFLLAIEPPLRPKPYSLKGPPGVFKLPLVS